MKAENALPDFDGDNKDQRSWTHWMAEWLYDVRKACKRGSVCLFIDWRQYPSITDALQWAGWIGRGLPSGARGTPVRSGRFRQQAEYGCMGKQRTDADQPPGVLPSGVFRYGNPQNRIHVTEKLLQLMKDVIQICEPGGMILTRLPELVLPSLRRQSRGFGAVGIEATDALISWKRPCPHCTEAGEEVKTKNHSTMSGRHLKKRRKIQMSKTSASGMLCGCFFLEKRRAEETCPARKEMVVLEQALAYVCCSAEEGKTKVQRYCRKIYELGYVPICLQYSFSHSLGMTDAEDMQAMRRNVPPDIKAVQDGGCL